MSIEKRRFAVACAECPLHACPGLRPLAPGEVAFMQSFKSGELHVARGDQVLTEGMVAAHVMTLLDGVLMRYKMLEDGRRQILNFLFPGDLIGLQSAMREPMMHSVEAVSDVMLCQFPRDRMSQLLHDEPDLGFDIIWLTAKDEASLDEHLLSVGRRSAREKVASLAMFLMMRGMQTGRVTNGRLNIPLTQAQISDTLGLSLVHTNRTLQWLRRNHLLQWTRDYIEIEDMERTRDFADFDMSAMSRRPFI